MSDAPKQSEAVTINLQPFIQPVSMLLSALIIAGSILISGNKVLTGSAVQGAATTATTTADSTTTTTPPPAATVSIDTVKNLYSGDYVKFGDANRKVLFVEVADPSCPYCHIAGGKNPELNKSAGAQFTMAVDGGTYVSPVEEMRKLVDAGTASYLYVYYPGHGNGQMAMKALYCAYEQGKFWQVHDLLMSSAGYTLQNTTVQNDKTKSQVIADFLKSVIDPGFIKSCLDSGKYDARLTSDASIASSLGVSGTPGFLINETKYDGAYSWNDMKATVTSALQ